MICPKCKKKVNWVAQLKNWDKEYGDDWCAEAMINIICYDCGTSLMMVELYESEDGEEIECPALKSKVRMPKRKVESKSGGIPAKKKNGTLDLRYKKNIETLEKQRVI